MGLQLVAPISRCPPLLQRTEGPRQAPPKGHSSAGQQVGRDPARVPRKWHSLRRKHRVVTPSGTCRLTFTTKGCLRLAPIAGVPAKLMVNNDSQHWANGIRLSPPLVEY